MLVLQKSLRPYEKYDTLRNVKKKELKFSGSKQISSLNFKPKLKTIPYKDILH